MLDNTIFLFQMDHGMETKSALYENGARIPQFIHYPSKYSPGSTFDAPVSTIDIGATMLDFAGITPTYVLDGMSWKDIAEDEDLETWWENDRCLFFELEKDRAVRCGCYKYLSIYAQSNDESSTFQRGNQKGLSNDLKNIFDLCDGTVDYITDPTTNTEAQNLLTSDTEKVSLAHMPFVLIFSCVAYLAQIPFINCNRLRSLSPWLIVISRGRTILLLLTFLYAICLQLQIQTRYRVPHLQLLQPKVLILVIRP